jgi:hypothetical protein
MIDQREALKIWEKYITELYDGDNRKLRSQNEDAQTQKNKAPIFPTVKWKNVIRQNICRPQEMMMTLRITSDCWKMTISNDATDSTTRVKLESDSSIR